MTASRALTWLCAEPDFSFTFNKVFRKGWPGLADFFLLPKPFTLGRAARFVERTIFIGGMAGFVYYGGLPLGSLGNKAGLTDALELAVMVKAIALIAGEATQGALKLAAYLIRGVERVSGFEDEPQPGGGRHGR
jgi:hypothetical protein